MSICTDNILSCQIRHPVHTSSIRRGCVALCSPVSNRRRSRPFERHADVQNEASQVPLKFIPCTLRLLCFRFQGSVGDWRARPDLNFKITASTMFIWPSKKLRTQAEGEVLRKLWKTGDATNMPETGGPTSRRRRDLFHSLTPQRRTASPVGPAAADSEAVAAGSGSGAQARRCSQMMQSIETPNTLSPRP